MNGLPRLADGSEAGEILFPIAGSALCERPSGAFDGEDWDLNLDSTIVTSAMDIADVKILPIIVRVRWDGPNGEQSVELRTVISDRD